MARSLRSRSTPSLGPFLRGASSGCRRLLERPSRRSSPSGPSPSQPSLMVSPRTSTPSTLPVSAGNPIEEDFPPDSPQEDAVGETGEPRSQEGPTCPDGVYDTLVWVLTLGGGCVNRGDSVGTVSSRRSRGEVPVRGSVTTTSRPTGPELLLYPKGLDGDRSPCGRTSGVFLGALSGVTWRSSSGESQRPVGSRGVGVGGRGVDDYRGRNPSP